MYSATVIGPSRRILIARFPLIHDIDNAVTVGGDRRLGHGHGLDQSRAKSFGVGRKEKNVHDAKDLGHVGPMTGKYHPVRQVEILGQLSYGPVIRLFPQTDATHHQEVYLAVPVLF